MLDRDALLAIIKGHEIDCAGADRTVRFIVDEVVEPADGVLVVCERDGEHTIYFDKSRYRVTEPFGDFAERIEYLKCSAAGFFYPFHNRSLDRTIAIAMEHLVPKDGVPAIGWHAHPVPVRY